MERLWAPWRMAYIEDEETEGCVFCTGAQTADEFDCLVLHKTALSLVMINKYPYSNGHLLVAPRRHVDDPGQLSLEELTDLFATVTFSISILKNRISAEGFNIGMNIGRTAGAGIEDHIHVHIVPRWHGDTNFMTIIDNVRVLPEALNETYAKLSPAFKESSGVMP